ncbi:hypothetical protein [Thiomicrorhabdus chilensis]|uniref:hypothetical protein n=1 Tax=Thiomicrorhabdus chilensis TaxID=63656 RepID=UPI00048B97BB|nr:hypothetical protein [Thiomicrorhabdus chilensis]
MNRSIIKLNDRITRLAQVASIDIQKIILDGSNLLNSQDDFIALKALIPVTNHLIKDYSVKVIFDPGASTILKINPAKLKNAFDERVEVIIATSEADELILDLAEDEKSIVLSKDGFAEFPDKDAVICKSSYLKLNLTGHGFKMRNCQIKSELLQLIPQRVKNHPKGKFWRDH